MNPQANHGVRAREGIQPLLFLLGEWEGEGMDLEGPVRAFLSASLLMDGSWIQVRERLVDGAGAVQYEDMTLYRFDPVEDQVKVLHLMPQAHKMEYPVLVSGTGFRWVTGPFGAMVQVSRVGDGWENRVVLPGETSPSLVVTYRRP